MSNQTWWFAHDGAERMIAEAQADVLTLYGNGRDTERAAELKHELAGLMRMHRHYCQAFAPFTPSEEHDGDRSDP